MMLHVYQGIVLGLVVLVAATVVRSQSRSVQATGALVLVVLLLRLFLVK
jgi:hypothetical protein